MSFFFFPCKISNTGSGKENFTDSAQSYSTSHKFGACFFLVTCILMVSTRYSEWFRSQFLIIERYLSHQSTLEEKSSFNTKLEGLTVKRKSQDKATTTFIAHLRGRHAVGMLYILGLLLRMPPWPLNKKQTMLWKLPVIVFTYSFRGCTPGCAVVGAVSCRGARPRLCLAQREWNRSGFRSAHTCGLCEAARRGAMRQGNNGKFLT